MTARYRLPRTITPSPVVWHKAQSALPIGEIRTISQLIDEAVLEYLQKHSPKKR